MEYRHQANVFPGYRPPTRQQRLKGSDGEPLRKEAEKSFVLMEWLVLQYTDPEDTVIDVQAGTAVLGLACIKHGRKYVGWESEKNIVDHAYLRLARFEKLYSIGLVDNKLPGYPREITDSISGGALWLPDHNVPAVTLGDSANANFGAFLPEDIQRSLGVWSPVNPDSLVVRTSLSTGMGGMPLGLGVFLERKQWRNSPLYRYLSGAGLQPRTKWRSRQAATLECLHCGHRIRGWQLRSISDALPPW